ncbi:uncharacterized protein LOC112328950 isoform X2 [Populus trichocarpa]|nr:uncharacterized protein LOC112328950 isoform X2 [Populus trichocarpa]
MHRRGNSRCKASSSNQNMTCEAAGTTSKAIPLETCKLSDDLNLLQLMLREKLCEIWDIHEKMEGVFPPLCCHNRIVFYGSRRICTICCRTLSLEELTGCTDGCTIPNKLRKSSSTSMQWSPGLDEAIHQCLIVSTLRLSNTDHFAVSMEEYSTNEQGSIFSWFGHIGRGKNKWDSRSWSTFRIFFL